MEGFVKGLGSVFAAYLVVWLFLFFYLLRLDAKGRALAREVEDLMRELEEARRGRGGSA
jgi:CcmD family protein